MFERLDDARVELAPFPHVILDEALEPALADELVRQMPPLSALTGGAELGSNKRFTLNSCDALAHPEVSPLWKEVVREGLSQRFLGRVMRLFGPYILRAFPDFPGRFGEPQLLEALPRHATGRPRGSVGMDAQPSVNTPALEGGTTVRGPHLDRTDKLFLGLLYLRPDGDGTAGGDLELYEALDERPAYLPKRLLPRDRVRLVKVVPYRRNTLVLFLNTPGSLHGVSPRAAAPCPRYFLNLVGEMAGPVFPDPCQQAPPTRGPRGLWDWLFGRAA